ncbi:hypothetical protein [Paenibacillus sp. M2]|uniref:hypothetical protein n=1 Tax=Paenibacillus sp. M2 TaxID=3341793 RepID=UPI003989B699
MKKIMKGGMILRKTGFLKIILSVLLLISLGNNFVLAQENEHSFDTEKYIIKRSYAEIDKQSILNQKELESSLLGLTSSSQMEIKMENDVTGEKIIGSVEELQTNKLYDLIDKKTGEEAVQFKTEIKASSDHQTKGNGSDSNNGMIFYETIYYTVNLDNPGFSYININKIDYRLEIQDSLYKVTEKKMEIQQNGMGINGKAVSNQTKIINLNSSGTIFPRDYGWTSVNVPSAGARVGTKTTAKIEVKGSTWNFSFPLNPR